MKKSSSQAKLVIWIAVAAMAVVLAFVVLRPAPASVESIDAGKLEELATTSGVRVLDVRSAGEYAQGHVPGAVNVPYTEVGVAAADWDREQPIAVYCLTGSRSDVAVTTLKSMGFSKIFHFDAGFQAWRGPVEAGIGSAAAAVETPKVSGPVMYEFYSDGWTYCQEMAPIVDRLKGEYEGRVEFRLVNVDTDPSGEQLAAQFGAPGWPTFVFLDSTGQRVNQIVGATPEANLRAALDALK